MKFLLSILLLSSAALADQALTWPTNPPEDGVIVYRVYMGRGTNAPLDWIGDTSSNVFTLPTLTNGDYRFGVSASNAFAESPVAIIVGSVPAKVGQAKIITTTTTITTKTVTQ